MINQKSIETVGNSTFQNGFRKPLYASYCFSRLPATIKDLLVGGENRRLPEDVVPKITCEHVVLFFVDGFGWRFFERYQDRFPFLKRFYHEGIASKLTAQFPSTTATHVTCMNTGLSTQESGIYEWYYYEPKLDAIITPLLFSYAGDKSAQTLLKNKVTPESIFPFKTVYQDLASHGVESFVFVEEEIAKGACSRVMFDGSKRIAYRDIPSALQTLRSRQIQQAGKKSYFYFYLSDIDFAGHHHGVDSPEFEREAEKFFALLEKYYLEMSVKSATAFLLVADHGMMAIDPSKTYYINQEYPECLSWIKKTEQNKWMAPAGSCRDFFLHIHEEMLAEAKEKLSERLKGVAVVYETSELIEQGFFGEGKPSQAFLERVGNLVILPLGDVPIWWHEKHRFEVHLKGMHGGLTPEEMEIPLLYWES